MLLKSSNNIAYLSLIDALQLNLKRRRRMMMRGTYLRQVPRRRQLLLQSAVLVVGDVMSMQRRRMIKPMPWLHRMLSSEL